VLQLSVREIEPKIAAVVFSGRIMVGPQSQKIEQQVADLLAKGYTAIIFDLSGVSHMDSTGVGQFIASQTQVMKVGSRLLLAAANPVIREVFRVTRLDSVFRFFDDIDSALKSLR
jgi:anti-sigma B factor antagonist